MFKDDVNNFPRQFEWEPQAENGDGLRSLEKIVILGMGGSHLAADVLTTWAPYAGRIIIHSDYGPPPLVENDLKKSLVVAVSHSGNTEEVLDGFNEALSKGLNLAAISSGGKLIELAQKNSKPYIIIPKGNLPPRLATGYHFRAILKIMGEEETLAETKDLAKILKPQETELGGRELAEKLRGRIPIIYASAKKSPVALIWKIKFNETAKIPAFCNFLPELNHNEMAGFNDSPETETLSQKFTFIFLEDGYDHPQNQKRMLATAELYRKKGLVVETIKLSGQSHWHKIFSATLLADWITLYLAEYYRHNPETTPLTEEFKKSI